MAKFATNTIGAMLLSNLVQAMESISGSVVPLAMFLKLFTYFMRINKGSHWFTCHKICKLIKKDETTKSCNSSTAAVDLYQRGAGSRHEIKEKKAHFYALNFGFSLSVIFSGIGKQICKMLPSSDHGPTRLY